MMPTYKYIPSCLFVLSLFLLSGCSSSEYDFVELEGVVIANGEVVPGVSMEFKPVGHEIKSSMADTEEDGSFRAVCTMSQAGVVRGENDVTFYFDRDSNLWDEGTTSASPELAKKLGKYCEENGPIRIEIDSTDKDYKFEVDLP